MDQCCRLEGLARLLVSELAGRPASQLVIDQWQELLGRLRVAVLDGREDARDVVHRREPLGRYRGKGPTPSPVARMASSPGPGDGESLPSGYPPRRRGDSQTQMASDFLATRLHFPPRITHRIHECICLNKRESPGFSGQTGLRDMDLWNLHVSDHAENASSYPKDARSCARYCPFDHIQGSG